LDIHIPLVNYYVASSPEEAYAVVGQSVEASGRDRLRAVKTFNRFDHIHEFVHVLAMELGLINPYFDEGLATAFEEGYRFTSRTECELALAQLETVFPHALNGDVFNDLNNKKDLNVYGVAQATMRFWLKTSGLAHIKKVLERTMQNPTAFQSILEQELGPLSKGLAGTKEKLRKAIQDLRKTFC
jgi:hypothetical protein